MRQAGILAAAGLIALEQGPQKLKNDHENARFLAEGLRRIPGFKIDPDKVQTNVVLCDITGTGKTSGEISCELAGHKLLTGGVGPELLRFVTHLDVNRQTFSHLAAQGFVATFPDSLRVPQCGIITSFDYPPRTLLMTEESGGGGSRGFPALG
jgi:threonine aldolase